MAMRVVTPLLVAIAFGFSLAITPDIATAQSGKGACSRSCDCDFECIDFCGSGHCPCPRLLKMQKACKQACGTCKRLSVKRKG